MGCLELIYRNRHRSHQNGWTSTAITAAGLALFLGANLALAAPSSPSFSEARPLIDQTFVFRLSLMVLTFLVAQAVIPAIRAVVKDYRQRKAFFFYLQAHVDNTLASYGRACSVEHAKANWIEDSPVWLDMLDKAGLGVPDTLLRMHTSVAYAATPEAHDAQYIPFLSYLGNTTNPLDHTHPIWNIKGAIAKDVSEYLISQEQIGSSLQAQYDKQYFKLIESDSIEKREQWCSAAFAIIEDMTEHYINALELRERLPT